MDDIINKILSDAVNAPSGDNSQPWEFKVRGNVIQIINLPNKDNPIFNFEQRGSYIAHGAIAENIIRLAPVYGYEAQISFFTEPQNKNLIISIKLEKGASTNADQGIIKIIRSRCTNRKKYNNLPLPEQKKTQILQAAAGQLVLAEDEPAKIALGQSASCAERVMLEYKPLHDAFFSMIRWSKKQEQELHGGLYIDTLELLPPQKLIFKWFSNWTASAFLRSIGFAKVIAKENSKIYAQAAAIGAIVMPNATAENFVKTGMLLQKVWLKATELDLYMQPIAGVLYLEQRLKQQGMSGLTKNLTDLIVSSVNTIYENFSNPDGIITMMFRIGEGDEPAYRSVKFPPVITSL